MPAVVLRRNNAASSRTRARLRRRDPQILRAPIRGDRVIIPVVTILRAGTTPAIQVESDRTKGHRFENGGRTFLEVVSTDGSPQTVTVITYATFDNGIPVEDLRYTINPGGTLVIGAFSQQTFNQLSSDSMVHVDVSVSGTLKFRAYALP